MTNPSLARKTASRVAAVQCLYQYAMGDEKRTPEQLVEALKKRLSDNKTEQKLIVGGAYEPNYPLLLALLAGTRERIEDIDKRLDGALKEDWKRNRMSPVLIALLQSAIFELFFFKEISPKIIVGEYTKIAGRFLDDKEVQFLHSALIALSEKYNH